jgi:hypothetical protein
MTAMENLGNWAEQWLDRMQQAVNNREMEVINHLEDENREQDIDWAYDVEPSLSQRYDEVMEQAYDLYY